MTALRLIIIVVLTNLPSVGQTRQVDLTEQLVEELRRLAAHQRRSPASVLEDAVRAYLAAHRVPDRAALPARSGELDPVSLSTTMKLADGTTVKFRFESNRLWTTAQKGVRVPRLSSFVSASSGRQTFDAKRPYLRTKSGRNVKITITAQEGPGAISVSPLGWDLQLKRAAGQLVVKLQVAEEAVAVAIPVIDAGLTGSSADDLVASHGIGDHDDGIFVAWPNSKHADGAFYSPSAGARSISRNHWRWHSRPGLVVALNGSTVEAVYSSPERIKLRIGAKAFTDASLSTAVKTRLSVSYSPLRVIERTKGKLAVAAYEDGGYRKVWVPATNTECQHYDCPLYRRGR